MEKKLEILNNQINKNNLDNSNINSDIIFIADAHKNIFILKK